MFSTMSYTVPVVQGAKSPTFAAPPLDGSLTFAEMLAFHAEHSPSHNLFVYTDGDDVKCIDYARAFRAQKVVASLVKAAYEAGKRLYVDEIARPIFGILASADSVTYATLFLGIQQTGAVPFPLSTRNSAVATAHLLRSTGVRQVFVSEDAAMRNLAAETADLLAKDGLMIKILDLPRIATLYDSESPVPAPDTSRIAPFSLDAVAVILHSSGTSAFPKPVKIIGHNYLYWGLVPYYGELDLCGIRLGIQATPIFHGMGMIMLVWAVCAGLELAVYKPARPPVVANPTSFLHELVASKSKWTLAVPAHIEEWSHDPESVRLLKECIQRIWFGGGPLNKHVGDLLQAQGIHLDSVYGLTEVGPITNINLSQRSRPAESWEYFRLLDPRLLDIQMRSHDDHNGLLEPVVMDGERFGPNVINTTLNGKPGYATGDLLQEHPVHKGIYKVYGRTDEQIMLSTGEKTNPVPLERILLQDPNVAIAIFFGRGRFNNGVLIQPKTPFDPSDAEKVKEFCETIWPTVSCMNEYAPAHSRVLKNMILVANPAKPLELTAKGSARRGVCLAKYEEEIEAIYATAGSCRHGPQPPASWTPETTVEFVQAVVEDVMNRKVDENDDLFALGCDSLAVSLIRNSIIRAFRTVASASSPELVRKVPRNIVYQYSSVHALSDFIFSLATGRDLEPDADAILQQKIQAMEAMVAKYSANLHSPRIPAGGRLPAQETVLVTGTTGRLGCHLLAQLIQDPKVRHVYALNRGSAGEASTEVLCRRMRTAFEAWELDPALLQSEKVTVLTCDYATEYLGLDAHKYAEIESQLTTIIHNAWRVDFNIVLSGFEPLVAGVRRLIDLACNAPIPVGARFLFVSSVGVLFNCPKDRPALEEPIEDPRVSAGIGYGESKWVAETLLLRARNAVGLRAGTVRVGQIAGDTRVGGWNQREWVGAIARLGQIVGALPERDETLSWVPVDIVATALIDMSRSEEPVFNLASPNLSDWKTVFGAFAKLLGLPLIEYDEWAARVLAAAEANISSEDIQPLALANFFQVGNFGEGTAISTTCACAASPALANMSAVGEKEVALYVDFWKRIGFLHA